MTNLIQYRIKKRTSQSSEADDFCVVVMGANKVGKTTFIRNLHRLNDKVTDAMKKIDTMFEYREYALTEGNVNEEQMDMPRMRNRAIETGNLFVLLFSVNDIKTFNFASDLRTSISEKKGKDVPVIFVGVKSKRSKGLTRSISFEFADLVVSCDLESKYVELSFANETELSVIHSEILRHQENHHAMMKSRTLKKRSSIGQMLYRLLSADVVFPNILSSFKTKSNTEKNENVAREPKVDGNSIVTSTNLGHS